MLFHAFGFDIRVGQQFCSSCSSKLLEKLFCLSLTVAGSPGFGIISKGQFRLGVQCLKTQSLCGRHLCGAWT